MYQNIWVSEIVLVAREATAGGGMCISHTSAWEFGDGSILIYVTKMADENCQPVVKYWSGWTM